MAKIVQTKLRVSPEHAHVRVIRSSNGNSLL
jgi:hypothetical protein